jgi:hypothetical protein
MGKPTGIVVNTAAIKILPIAVMLLITSSTWCQDYNWHLTMTHGDDFKNVALERLIGDSLVILQMERSYKIPIHSLYSLRNEKESKFGKGAVIGALLGATAGGLIPTSVLDRGH